MNQNNGNPAPASHLQNEQKGWSNAERRTLLITVIGTLVANLGTVVLVAAAVVLDRYLAKHPRLQGKDFALTFPAVLLLSIVLFSVTYYYHRRHGDTDYGLLWLVGLSALFLLTMLLGYAAGVSSH